MKNHIAVPDVIIPKPITASIGVIPNITPITVNTSASTNPAPGTKKLDDALKSRSIPHTINKNPTVDPLSPDSAPKVARLFEVEVPRLPWKLFA